MSAVRITTVGAAYTMDGKHLGPGPWLGLIHECNRLTGGKMFGSPVFVNDERGHVEVYPDAEVIHVGTGAQDTLVTMVSRNELGGQLMRQAAKLMGLSIDGEPLPDDVDSDG